MSQAQPLPHNWQQLKDQYERSYYYNTATGVTQWESPIAAPHVPPPPIAAPHVPPPSSLPPNWQELQDPTGRIYYRHDLSNTSQWSRPLPISLLPLDTTPIPPHETDGNKSSEAIDLFNELLRTVFSTQLDMHTRRPAGQVVMTMELQQKILSCLKDNSFFYTLRDKNNLTILGYIILTNKTSMMAYYIENLNKEMARTDIGMSQRIKKIVGDKFNEELEFILTHRVNGVDTDIMHMLTRYIIGDLFPTFALSERNAHLLGYLMLTKIPPLRLEDRRAMFSIPDKFSWRPPPSLGGKLEKKYKLSRRTKLYKRKGSRKHYSRRRGHRGGAMTTLNPAIF
jgi:hypothetical protein